MRTYRCDFTALFWGAFALLFCVFASSSAVFAAGSEPGSEKNDGPGARRFALLVAANDGGAERATLRYAASDAQALGDVLVGLGGVRGSDQTLLVDPTPRQLDQAIAQMGQKIGEHRQNKGRAEFIFYYSGHSDEQGLLLKDAPVSYAALRGRLDQLDAHVRLVILDSCASGSFTRAKGGRRVPSFLDDSANQISGYAVLTSSSEDEVAQESDAIGGSFFTHYLISGLRGAADSSGNGRVTLNEAYRYAFDQTLARTHQSLGGAQHARYDIQMSGHGELVLTDLQDTSARLVLDAELQGRVWVRDAQGRLMAEVPKFAGRALNLGVAPGTYRVEWAAGDAVFAAQKNVTQGAAVTLVADDFSPVDRESTRARGGQAVAAPAESADESSAPKDAPRILFGVDIVPGLGTSSATPEAIRMFSLNIAGGMSGGTGALEIGGAVNLDNGPVRGAQLAGALNTSEELHGAQFAGAVNFNAGLSRGAQLAGALNTGEELSGAQFAGGVNLIEQEVSGLQVAGGLNMSGAQTHGIQLAGGMNYTGQTLHGAQIVGGLNFTRESVHGLQLGGINVAGEDNHGLQLGVVNISKSSNASIGLINIFRDGYVQPEVFGSDDGLAMAGIRHGSRNFYSVYHLGAHIAPGDGRAFDEALSFAYGLGFGWRAALTEHLDLSTDITTTHIITQASGWHMDNLIKLRPMLSVQLTDAVALFGGPTLSFLIGEKSGGQSRMDAYENIGGWTLTADDSKVDVAMWPGLTLGARFL